MVIYIKKDKKITLDEYSTPGFANDFLNDKGADGMSTLDMLKETLTEAFKGFITK